MSKIKQEPSDDEEKDWSDYQGEYSYDDRMERSAARSRGDRRDYPGHHPRYHSLDRLEEYRGAYRRDGPRDYCEDDSEYIKLESGLEDETPHEYDGYNPRNIKHEFEPKDDAPRDPYWYPGKGRNSHPTKMPSQNPHDPKPRNPKRTESCRMESSASRHARLERKHDRREREREQVVNGTAGSLPT
ncbi:hypothetical protein BDW02DRAFT_573954 [Decorospora gaudefroyi]|uniref:Uncharacterized protein n=1 Tax=Decorospora gaudefroyi TaxID=184978 RepID=A0A6A5K0A8_9PLEO|nr:hypothetical protein BDW02DRAFT_573954 [Decorospora gaudefroyi]